MKILKISLSVLFLMAFAVIGLQAQSTSADLKTEKATQCSMKASATKDANCTPGCCALCPPACCKGKETKAMAASLQTEDVLKAGKKCCSLLPLNCCKAATSNGKATTANVMAENVSLDSAKKPCCKTKTSCTKTNNQKSTTNVMAENVSLNKAKKPCCSKKSTCTKQASKEKITF